MHILTMALTININCHVCVVDNNGKLVKALATYVYTYKNKDKPEEGKEWRLIKMNS